MLDKIIHFALKHRWLVVLLAIAAGAYGFYSLRRLPIDAVPDITNNQIQINTVFPSMTPFEIEKQVTFPVETTLAGIPGLQSTRSLSRNGFSQVTAVFEDGVDIYFARSQVNERLGQAREALPPGATPVMGPISTGLGEVYMWTVEFEHPEGKGALVKEGQPGWQSDGSYLTPEGPRLTNEIERAAYLRTVQDWIVRPQLKNVKGVAGVDSNGGHVKQYHVQPDPMKLVSYGLGFSDVVEALEKNNVSTGAGFIEHKGEAYTVRAAGRIETPNEISEIVVGSRNGTPIYIRDVASVAVGKELRTGSASENGRETVLGLALMRIGENSRTVAAAVDRKMVEVRRSLPPDIATPTVLNRQKLVDATISTVAKNLAEGAALVIVILFLMLGNIRAALITALTIPLSMLLAAIGMLEHGVSGNLMSLGAVDFGLIVDGAVIIVENCLRKLAEKQHHLGRPLTLEERLHEVAVAAKEMVKPSVYGQGIIITVYIPILVLTGVEGKMFHPMAMTVIFALVGAFVLSLTFVPALVALFVTGKVQEKEQAVVRWVKGAYEPLLRQAIHRRWLAVPVAVFLFAGSLFLFTRLGQEFTPSLDEIDLVVMAARPTSTGIEQTTRMQLDLEENLMKHPEVERVFSRTGTAEMATDPMPPNFSDTFIILKPKKDWPESHDKADLIARIEKSIADLPGNLYEFSQPIQMRFNELVAGVRGDVAVKVYGDEFEKMQETAQEIAKTLGAIRGAADIKVEQTAGLPLMNIQIDRAAIARYGLSVADVQDVVASAIGGREAGLVFEGDRRFELVVRLPDSIRQDLEAIENLPIPIRREENGVDASRAALLSDALLHAGGMGFVPLGAVAKIEIAEGPNQISRENGKRRIVVQANVRGRDLGSFVEEAQRRVAQVKVPAGSWIDWGGQFENLVAARERLSLVVPLCFFLILLLLFSAFNSVRFALLVFSGIPLGLTGGIIALWLRDIPFSISAAVGFIALSGVAVLNGLVMVSFINQLRAEGVSVETAIRKGCLTRLRPVLMTALVASLGFVPMAFATGTGAEVQRPLATVVIGGLVSSTVLTLIVLPALYRIFAGRIGKEGEEITA